jgi:dephospho-CoA kinase
MRRIGLTGGIATGKSHVRAQFEQLGVPTVDADVLAREAVAPGTPGLAAVVARFGSQVLAPDRSLDRKALAAIVFADPSARRDLEAIVHPRVRAATDDWFRSLPTETPFAIADIPLLYETGRDADFDQVVLVACDPESQVRRVIERDGVTEADARARLAAQLPIGEKVTRADFVIRTDGTKAETDAQVRETWARLARAAQDGR